MATFGLLLSACASDTTAPTQTLSIATAKGAPLRIGALTIVGASTMVDSMFQVSVTVKNDGTAPVSFSYGRCGLAFALYQSATYSGSPVWPIPKPRVMTCYDYGGIMQVEPGQSRTLTDGIPSPIPEIPLPDPLMQDLGAIATGTYYVAAGINLFGNLSPDGLSETHLMVDAGAVTIQ